MSSVKKNFVYSSFLTVSNYIINLVLFPYCAHVLGVEKFGTVNFAQNVVQYFLFIAMMGITHIGVREIAKQSTQDGLNRCFSSMIALNTIYTVCSLIIYIPLILFIKRFVETQTLFLLGGFQILFTQFSIEWFFRGIEDFRFITIRNVIIKILYVLSVFFFVRNDTDYVQFFALTVGMTIVTSCVNCFYARRKVRFIWKDVNLKIYMKSTLQLGAYSILTSMYTTFNVAFLGLIWNDTQVGYYTTALKLYTVILGFYSAFTSVMLPRMTSLIGNNDANTFRSFINKSFELLFTITIPITIFLFILAPEIILLLAGNEYIPSIEMSRMVVPMLFVVGVAQILSFQVLIPKGYDKATLYASIIGAAVGIISNIVLTVKLGAFGTCITVVITETIVTCYYCFVTAKSKMIELNKKPLINHVLFSIPYIPICIVSHMLFYDSILLTLGFACLLSIAYFLYSQMYILKNALVISTFTSIKSRVRT